MLESSSNIYSKEFYNRISTWSLSSANVIVPLIIDLFHPESVIDIGCGDGTWLSVFRDAGVSEIMGIDGNYVREDFLKIPADKFKPHDLNKAIILDCKYDVAISLEVAEHIEQQSSEIFVNSLSNISDFVVFSAAIPFQPGDNHINCQWPEYWISLFGQNGFTLINSLKYRVWNEPEVAWFYKQNILAFAKTEKLNNNSVLEMECEKYKDLPVTIIHPENLMFMANLQGKRHQEVTFNEIVLSRIRQKFRHIKSNYFRSSQ